MPEVPQEQPEQETLLRQQRVERRAANSIRLKTILETFWYDDARSDIERAMEIEGYLDALGGVDPDELRWAWAKYQRDGPRTASGRLVKPDGGALYNLVRQKRQKDAPEPEPDQIEFNGFSPVLPHRQRPTPEETEQILREIGFEPRRVGKSREVDHAEARKAEAAELQKMIDDGNAVAVDQKAHNEGKDT